MDDGRTHPSVVQLQSDDCHRFNCPSAATHPTQTGIKPAALFWCTLPQNWSGCLRVLDQQLCSKLLDARSPVAPGSVVRFCLDVCSRAGCWRGSLRPVCRLWLFRRLESFPNMSVSPGSVRTPPARRHSSYCCVWTVVLEAPDDVLLQRGRGKMVDPRTGGEKVVLLPSLTPTSSHCHS